MSAKVRFIEELPETGPEKARQKEGWIIILDRATGHAMILHANSREGALWFLHALNHAEATADRFPCDTDVTR